MVASLPQWLKKNSAILFNTGSLIGTMVITSVLGFAYWWVAARFFTPSVVGLASAATSSMLLLSTFCLLGLGTLLITELPRNPGREGPFISTAVILVGGVSLIIGAAFALVAPSISSALRPLGANAQNIVLFAISISCTSVTAVVDQAVIGLLRGGLQFWRNTLFAVAKLVALYGVSVWLSDKVGMTVYATWTLGNLLSLVPLLGVAVWKGKLQIKNYLPRWYVLRKLGASALQHHVLNLILQAPVQILPVLVTVLLSAAMNAWFYVASMIANFVFSISLSLTTVLHATNAAHRTTLAQKTRLTVVMAAITSTITSAILLLAGGKVLGFFGPTYAEQASLTLRVLALGSFPLIVKNHYIAIRRIKDEITHAMFPITLASILELVMAGLGAHIGGLAGLSLGWVIALCVEALFMFPLVFKTIIGADPEADAISSIVDADTLILTAIRPNTFAEPLSNMMTAPTQKLQAIMGLDTPTDSVKSLVFVNVPTQKLGFPEGGLADEPTRKLGFPQHTESLIEDMPTLKKRRNKKLKAPALTADPSDITAEPTVRVKGLKKGIQEQHDMQREALSMEGEKVSSRSSLHKFPER